MGACVWGPGDFCYHRISSRQIRFENSGIEFADIADSGPLSSVDQLESPRPRFACRTLGRLAGQLIQKENLAKGGARTEVKQVSLLSLPVLRALFLVCSKDRQHCQISDLGDVCAFHWHCQTEPTSVSVEVQLMSRRHDRDNRFAEFWLLLFCWDLSLLKRFSKAFGATQSAAARR